MARSAEHLSEELRLLRQELYNLQDRAGYNNQALDGATREARMADVREQIELVKQNLRGSETGKAAEGAVPKPMIWLGKAEEWADWVLKAHKEGHLPEAKGWGGGRLKALELAAPHFLWKRSSNNPPESFKPKSVYDYSQRDK